MEKNLIQYLFGRVKSFKNAFQGLVYALRTQKNAQIHLVATVIVLLLGYALKISIIEFMIILLCVSFVWAAELLNTAIESLVDLCSPDYHPFARISKDLAAAAVLISALASAVIGFLIFIPRIINLGK